MDNTKNNIDDFKLLLQKQSIKKPSFLYHRDLNPSEETYRPQDVIKTVSSQVKALQLADYVRGGKSVGKDLSKAQKSLFLPLNKLSVYGTSVQEVPKANPHKFETQCVLDTQLMDLIDGAAPIDANTGMTQEFDTTFTHTDDLNMQKTKHDEKYNHYDEAHGSYDVHHKAVAFLDDDTKNITISGQRCDKLDVIDANENNTENQPLIDPNIALHNLDNSIDVNIETNNSQLSKTATEDTVTFIENLPITQEVNEELEATINNSKEIDIDKTSCSTEMDITIGQEKERSPSPVLNTKAVKRKLKTPSPLVVSLDAFENFENIAMSLIEETDFETAKHLINSQILNKELCFNDAEVLLGIERDNSPILDFKSDELQINSDEMLHAHKSYEVVSLQNIEGVMEKRSEVLKDEILFSSDEEDFLVEEYQNLPPTCALDTSNEQTGITDKSMFVGFQTASNKSIQICRDSYEQAQNILSNDDAKAIEELSLTELVEKCDKLKPKRSQFLKATKLKSDSNKLDGSLRKEEANKDKKEFCKGSEINNTNCSRSTDTDALKSQNFQGFMTASNKKINMSVKALERCQKVFEYIDLNENFDTVKESENTNYPVEIKLSSNKPENKEDITVNAELNTEDNINDKLILEEFENIEMSLEENENTNKDKGCVEFKTTNNKNTMISKEAVAKSKNLFQDIDMSELNKQFNNAGNDIDTCKEVNSIKDLDQPSTSKTRFIGFKTANNKEIKISDDALAKSKDVFKDIGQDKHKLKSIDDIISQPSTSNTVFVGFKTANNKDIKISDKSMSKTKIIFKDIDKEQTKIDTPRHVNRPSTSKTIIEGFKTIRSNNNKETDYGLYKFKNILNDNAEKTFVFCDNEEPEPAFKGFKSASDKEVEICDQATQKNQSTEINMIQKAKAVHKSMEMGFVGFKTANNKAVNVSAEALQKSKQIFSNINPIDPYDETEIFTIKNKDENTIFKGFQTASKKPVTVSADALARSKIIFKDIHEASHITSEKLLNNAENSSENGKHEFTDLNSKNSNANNQQCSDKNKDQNTVFKGFQTASKKPVTVSADALAKSKRIFKDIDEVIIPGKNPNNINVELGVQTANEKPIDTNKEALIATNLLLDDISNQMESRTPFVGFKTASNKKVNISEQALAKCKKIFDDIEDIPITVQPPAKFEPKEEIFRGFQAANNKEVDIAIEALEKRMKLFDEDNNDFVKQDTAKSFVGFQTANNNKVVISKHALAKSRQLFQDIDTESDIDILKQDNNIPYNQAIKKHTIEQNIGFKTCSNKDITISDDAITRSKKLFAEHNKNDKLTMEKTAFVKYLEEDVNIDKILDTQVMNDFEKDICTEDFKQTKSNKRSGSPILMCPKAKKRKKFETPYKTNPKTIIELKKDVEVTKPTNNITFREDYKKNKKYTLKDLTDFEKGNNQSTDPYILNFTLDNILNFEFDESRNDFKEGKINIDEIKHIFTEATDRKLIPDGWLDIHLKLILWKLLSYEIRFPTTIGKVTVKNVIDQLKFRYDKELYNAERSVLRKILEKDDVPSKTMVLCVAGIYVDGVSVVSAANLNNVELLLTDGWYFVKATIDNMLSKLVYDGKIVVGSKIVTCGAELVNCEQGVSPWEDTSSIRLAISGNSTRPARWDEKLGLRPRTMVAALAAVRMGGGKVAGLRARVVRVYPRLYVEKFQDGSTVTRSERLEHHYQMKYEAEREAMIEKIYEEVEKEMSDQEFQDSEGTSDPSNKRKCVESGSQIAKLMKISKDPMEFRAHLTSSQVHLLQDHVSKQRDKYLQMIQDRVQERLHVRNVVTLARGRIAGLERDGDTVTVTKGMLSVWKPNDEVLDIFKEGSWIEVTNVVPTAFRNSEIQLSAGRQSVFRPVKCEEDIFNPQLISLARTCYNLKDLSQNPSLTTEYNEIDTVGMIFSIDPSNEDFDSNKNQFQNVYLADIDKNMIGVNFWGGVKKFGYENILDTGQVIYCGNLQKRAGNTRKNIPQFRATEFALFTSTPKNVKGREMVEEISKKMFGLDRRKFCEDCIAVKQNYSVIRCLNDSENVSPYRFNNSDYNLGRNKMFIDTPVVQSKNKAEDFNLTGLDFESTFKQQDTQLSPKTLERKKKVNERIAKLKMYGEPPPLSPIHIVNKSKHATNSFKSPLVKDDSATTNSASAASVNKLVGVATPVKLPDDSVKIDLVSSPIISNVSMNRTYIKRIINPVKLNFSSKAIEESVVKTVDNFAEEFDGSPPLSLE